MKLLKALSLLAALALLGGAVLDAQTGMIREVLSGTPDAGKNQAAQQDDSYMHATKAAPLIHVKKEVKDAGK